MIIGSILLGVVIVLGILGLLRSIFTEFKISTLIALIVLGACPLLMLIPDIRIAGSFYMNIGGYIIPMAAVIFFIVLIGLNTGLIRAFVSSLLVATVVTLSYLFIPSYSTGLRVAATISTGLIAGGVAYLASGSSIGSIMSVLLGVMLADISVYLINMGRGVSHLLILGNARSFDVWVLAAVTAIGISELVKLYRRRSVRESRHALSYEMGEDSNLEDH